MPAFIIGISGGSCSGKTTLAERLGALFVGRAKVIHLDRYYKSPPLQTVAPITRREYAEHNHPDCMDLPKILRDVDAAAATHEVVVVEGLFALYFEKLRERLNLKVFVDLQSDERLYRRIKRWLNKQSMEEIADRFLDTVRYRHDEFIEPMRWHADLVLNGTLDSHRGVDVIKRYVEQFL